MVKGGFVYILTTKNNKMLYIGVTNSLERRIAEHKSHTIPGYTDKYNVTKLVYYQEFPSINEAIEIEKKLKGWLRSRKNTLVSEFNPEWKDLAE